ncbi:hypothetical protein AC623_14045 [Bacillus sp. FJAT-27231]|uniref:VWA domain-containing protein n=1 Tax=Bacillus sp. FJAT-27231 TaxID=1679168 RepID=UPI0006715ABF|nr:VWA domain-containing protein [Bacillus sp. FJAT-27231]KMY54918.1 hypothetical protein AC623_14045 [Bacillus sp. FJAT-27231]
MAGRSTIFKMLLAFLLILSVLPIVPREANAATATGMPPSMNFNVTAMPPNVVLSTEGRAESTLKLKVSTNGLPNEGLRQSVNVAFLYDTSKSMHGGQSDKKFISEQRVFIEALSYFNNRDNTVFIPFRNGVPSYSCNGGNGRKYTVGTTKSFSLINTLANQCLGDNNVYTSEKGTNAPGGTNYAKALKTAIQQLDSSGSSYKNIILFSDGKPNLLENETKHNSSDTQGITAEYERAVKQEIDTIIESMKSKDIKLYSVGVGNGDDGDVAYLNEISSKTGGYALEASDKRLPDLFTDIVSKPSSDLTGKVEIDLDTVVNEKNEDVSSFVEMKGDTSGRKKIYEFDLNRSNFSEALPLIFKKEGTYTIKSKLTYGKSSGSIIRSTTIYVTKKEVVSAGIDFAVKASPEKVIKPTNENAKSELNIDLTPKGIATQPGTQREPVDIVFVYDTSSAMAQNGWSVMAQSAMKSTLKTLKASQISNDNYYFIPFDSNISRKRNGMVASREGLTAIEEAVDSLVGRDVYGRSIDYSSSGGANYSIALEEAVKKFSGPIINKRYIIFLTAGKQTEFVKREDVNEKKCIDYAGSSGNCKQWSETIRNNAWVKYGIKDGSTPYRQLLDENKNVEKDLIARSLTETQIVIHNGALTSAEQVKNSNAVMNIVTFTNSSLLNTMAAKTGGAVQTANEQNLNSILTSITQKVDAPSIRGNVEINLRDFGSSVIVGKDSKFTANEGIVKIPFTFHYPVGGNPDPVKLQELLPLEFTAAGTYDFTGKVKISYKDLDGQLKELVHPAFKVEVVKDAPPVFKSTVEVLGNSFFEPEGLVKIGNADSESNEFTMKYTLTPDTVFGTETKGTISQIVLRQPLPDGVEMAGNPQLEVMKETTSIPGASVKQEGKMLIITLGSNGTTSYMPSSFTPNRFVVKVKLKAAWALPSTEIPRSTLYFKDSRFADNQENQLAPADKKISMRVLLYGTGQKSYDYVGDHTGTIQKVHQSDAWLMAETKLSNENGEIVKPVKGMELVNAGTAIKLTYSDGSTALLYMKTDYNVFNNFDAAKKPLHQTDGPAVPKTEGPVAFEAIYLVAGEEVQYEYRLTNKESTTSWQTFDPQMAVPIFEDYLGQVDIEVRTSGGFTLDSNPIKKSIEIIKPITEITVNPTSLNVVKGKSVDFTVAVFPEDTTEGEYDIIFEDPSIASVPVNPEKQGEVDEWKLTGLKAGTTTMTVQSKINPNIKAEVPVSVGEPITGIIIKPSPLEVDKGKSKEFTVTLEPKTTVENDYQLSFGNDSLADAIMKEDHSGDGDVWVLEGLNAGETELIVSSLDNPDIQSREKVTIHEPITGIAVVPDNEKIKTAEQEPEKWKVDKGVTGNFTVAILPESTTKNKEYTVTLDKEWSRAEKTETKDKWSLIGTESGTVTMTVTAKEDPNVKETIVIEFIDPFVELEGISFTKPHYDFQLGETENEWIPITDYVNINPDDATDVEVIRVESAKSSIVETRIEGGEWQIKVSDNQAGYSTVTVTAEQPNKEGDGKKTASGTAVFEVSKPSSDSGGGDHGDDIEGRW